MYKLETFLEAAERYEVSGIHLSAGEHPHMRIKGKLRVIDSEKAVLTEENVIQIRIESVFCFWKT
jgi:Tfp pilus assembly pilus retraction ATPase PilT